MIWLSIPIRTNDSFMEQILKVTNHMVGGDGGTSKPALGESWKSVPHVRLQLSRLQGSNICNVSIRKHPSMVCNYNRNWCCVMFLPPVIYSCAPLMVSFPNMELDSFCWRFISTRDEPHLKLIFFILLSLFRLLAGLQNLRFMTVNVVG